MFNKNNSLQSPEKNGGKDQNPLNQYSREIILMIISWIVTLILGYYTNHPKLLILSTLILLIIGLIYVHCKKIVKINQITEKTENKYKYSEKARVWAGILIIGLLSATTLVQTIPSTNHLIQSELWPTFTPTSTLTPALTYTITPAFTPTIEKTINNAFTSTITPTQTKGVETVNKDIIQGCLSEAWKEWPNSVEYGKNYKDNCIEYPLGKMIKNNEGLLISNDPQEQLTFGITSPLPDNNVDIQVKFSIDEFATNNTEAVSELYFGFADSSQKDSLQKPTGKFIIFRACQKEYPPTIVLGEYPKSEIANQTLRSSVEQRRDFTIIFQKNKLSFDLLIIGAGEPIEKTDIQYNPEWDSFFIGYVIPRQSNLVATITDVQFIDK